MNRSVRSKFRSYHYLECSLPIDINLHLLPDLSYLCQKVIEFFKYIQISVIFVNSSRSNLSTLRLGNGTGCTGTSSVPFRFIPVRPALIAYGTEWDIPNWDTKRNGTKVWYRYIDSSLFRFIPVSVQFGLINIY